MHRFESTPVGIFRNERTDQLARFDRTPLVFGWGTSSIIATMLDRSPLGVRVTDRQEILSNTNGWVPVSIV